ncbi:hypothetical protein [Salidesulfovibrio onnuriiensis]|uniref:hypothetical protein n=1 Tax=Salidesulfovibrio onnuriiensis TaxID=2583823 RepID=UPI0011C91A2E|nr:hypothetical protein [Salidesulfovibrio onnuriiensis]
MDSTDITCVLLGAAFIVYFTGAKFHRWTPDEKPIHDLPPRSYTSFGRFAGYKLCYTACYLLAYAFILFLPQVANEIVRLVHGEEMGQLLTENKCQLALWASFILSGVLPSIPALKKADFALRKLLHIKAQIPSQAMAVIRQMNHEDAFNPDEEEFGKLEKRLATDLRCDTERLSEQGQRIFFRLCKAAYLGRRLRFWQETPRHFMYLSKFPQLFQTFDRDYERIKNELEHYSGLMQSGELPEEVYRRLYKRLGDIIETAYTIICCGIYRTKRSQAHHRSEFHFFGLDPKLPPVLPFELDTIILTLSGVFIVTVVLNILLFTTHIMLGNPAGLLPAPGESLGWGVAAVILHGSAIALVSALHMGRSLFKASHGGDMLENDTFYITYIALGFGCGLLSGAAILKALTLLPGNTAGNEILLWALAPGCTGGFISWYILRIHNRLRSPWLTAAVQGLALALVSAIILAVLMDCQLPKNYDSAQCLKKFIELRGPLMLLLALFIGGIIGFTFPKRYRLRLWKQGIIPYPDHLERRSAARTSPRSQRRESPPPPSTSVPAGTG